MEKIYEAQAKKAEEAARGLFDPFFKRHSMSYFIHGATQYGMFLPEYSDVDFQACFELSSFRSIEDCDRAIKKYSNDNSLNMSSFVNKTTGRDIYVYIWPELKIDLGLLQSIEEFEEAKRNTEFQKKIYNGHFDIGIELKTAFHKRPDYDLLKISGLSFAPLMAIALHIAREKCDKNSPFFWELVARAVENESVFSAVSMDNLKNNNGKSDILTIYQSYTECYEGHDPEYLPRDATIDLFRGMAAACRKTD